MKLLHSSGGKLDTRLHWVILELVIHSRVGCCEKRQRKLLRQRQRKYLDSFGNVLFTVCKRPPLLSPPQQRETLWLVCLNTFGKRPSTPMTRLLNHSACTIQLYDSTDHRVMQAEDWCFENELGHCHYW